MIDASDLTTVEVRSQYVLPLIQDILEKSSLIDCAALLRIDGVVRCDDVSSSTFPGTDATPPNYYAETTQRGVGVNTLFQEIATEYPPSSRVPIDTGAVVGKDESDAADVTIKSATARCYAELLEEASALCAYLTPQESTIVATVASSCLLAFLIPHSHFQGFLRSYYDASAETNPSVSIPDPLSLEERLVNATLSNQNHTSGGVFPYSASRMISLVVDDDGFTSSSFHRFLLQGLRPYLSCGMAFNLPPKDNGSKTNIDDAENGISCDAILFQAGLDLIQLMAMAICPNPPNENSLETEMPASLSMDADKGAGGDLDDVRQLANSTLPFSFQLSYSDRIQFVRLCAELAIPEREDGAFDTPNDGGRGDSRNGYRNDWAMSGVVLHQLRSALFGFASYGAHSEKDAGISYKALANVAMNEGKSLSIQAEFQRLLHATIESKSEYLAFALGDCLQGLVTRYNGSRYYADGAFVRFALGLLGERISDGIRMSMAGDEKSCGELTIGTTIYNALMNENANKRQKTGDVLPTTAKKCKPFHLIALLKVARPLFYFLLDNNAGNKSKENGGLVMEAAEHVAKSQLVKDVTLLLSYPSSLAVVQSASQSLALALSYHGKYMDDKSNVKHLYRFTRQALGNVSGSVETVQALRPLLITASKQSRAFAASLLSYSIKNCSENKTMMWKIATVISSARPSVVSNRLAELAGCSHGSDKICSNTARDEIMTRLSCKMASYTNASSESMQRCLSLSEGITNHWSLFQLVRFSFTTSNFGLARQILNQRQLPQHCSRQQSFLWMTILLKIAEAEEMLGNNGASGISDSLETLNSCHSTLFSLAATVQNNPSQKDMSHTGTLELGRFGFQLDFLRVRMDFLNLCMITRSLCSEIIVTGGNVSARSNLVRHNIPKSFGMLESRYINIYRLHGLHHCQQTKSILRIYIAMCKFMRDFVDAMLSCQSKLDASKKQQGVVQDCCPKVDERYSMGSLLTRLRAGVLEKFQVEKSKDGLLHAPELLNLLDTLLRCPSPFPPGFFHIMSIACSCINLSADTGLLPKKKNDDHIPIDTNRAECVDVTSGLPFKLILSGIIPEEFIRSADVEFNQIIAVKTLQYEGQLYEDDDAEDTHSEHGNGGLNLPIRHEPFSTTLQPCGQFIMPILCEPIVREGFYRIELKLGCRDVRCTEWAMPTTTPLEIFLRVEYYSE